MLSNTASQMEQRNEKRMESVKKRISKVIKRQNQLLVDLKGRIFKILDPRTGTIMKHIGATEIGKTWYG